MAQVFPPRNLNGLADNWGREVQRRIEAEESSRSRTLQDINNSMRANAGQMAVVSSQVSELSSRTIYPFTTSTISVSGGVGTASSAVSETIPGTGDARRAQVTVYVEGNVPSGENFVNMFLEVSFRGAVVARGVGKPSPTTTGPSGWPQFTANVSGYISVPASGGSLTIRVYRTGATGAPTNTLTATGFGSVFFGDRDAPEMSE